MDLSQLTRACDFSITLSMGEIHSRSLTGPWITKLEQVAKSDAADEQVTRTAMRLAARDFPRPENEKFDDPDDPGSGDQIEAAATPEDLEAFAAKLIEVHQWLIRTTRPDENPPARAEAESAIAFFRRCVVWHHDKFKRIREDMLGIGPRAAMKRMTQLNDSIRYQMEHTSRVRDAIDSVPRVEDRLEAMADAIDTQFNGLRGILENLERASVKAVGELEAGSKTAARSILIAAISVLITAIISGLSLARDMYEFKMVPDSKPDPALAQLVEQLRTANEELRAIRAEANTRAALSRPSLPSSFITRDPPRAPSSR